MSRSHPSGFNLIHRSDLLNALLAIQSAHQAIPFNHSDDREREIYQAGFDAALLAVAQMLGQSEIFLAQKTTKHRSNSF